MYRDYTLVPITNCKTKCLKTRYIGLLKSWPLSLYIPRSIWWIFDYSSLAPSLCLCLWISLLLCVCVRVCVQRLTRNICLLINNKHMSPKHLNSPPLDCCEIPPSIRCGSTRGLSRCLSVRPGVWASWEQLSRRWVPGDGMVTVWHRRRLLTCIITLGSSDAYMRQYTRSSLGQIMAWRLLGAKPLSEPMLPSCQLRTLGNKPQWNFNWNSLIFSQ